MPYVRRLRVNDSRILPHERGVVDAAIASSLLQVAEEGCARVTNLGFVVRIVTMNPSPPPRPPLINIRIVTMNPSPPPRGSRMLRLKDLICIN